MAETPNASQIASIAAERAAELVFISAEKTQKLAVERAVRDANVDRDLQDHAQHLKQINGSQLEMASSLKRLEKGMSDLATTFDIQVKIQEALTMAVQKQTGIRFSRRSSIIAIFGVIAAYCTLVALVLINVH